MLYDCWYASGYCSVASLETAYGLIGRTHSRSLFGSAGLRPYTDDDDAATTWETPRARAASRTASVPVAFAA